MDVIGINPEPQFPLGETAITSEAAAKLDMVQVKLAIARHASGDWGEMDADKRLAKDGTFASIYKTAGGVKFYVLTQADRSKTTVLLAGEY